MERKNEISLRMINKTTMCQHSFCSGQKYVHPNIILVRLQLTVSITLHKISSMHEKLTSC